MVNVNLVCRPDDMDTNIGHVGIIECKEVKISQSSAYNGKIKQIVILKHDWLQCSVLHAKSVFKTRKNDYTVVLDNL